jgi:hypothetical protein
LWHVWAVKGFVALAPEVINAFSTHGDEGNEAERAPVGVDEADAKERNKLRPIL